MPNMGVTKYQAGAMTWVCGNCLQENTDTITADSKKVPNMNFYENFHFVCKHCPGTLFVNLNIPESDYDEMEFEVKLMPFHEIDARKQIRDAMYAHRSDLKALNASEKAALRGRGKENAPRWKRRGGAMAPDDSKNPKANENATNKGGR